MFIGALVICTSLVDVTSCDLKVNGKQSYDTQEECMQEVTKVAQHTAYVLGLPSRPYCFKLEIYNT